MKQPKNLTRELARLALIVNGSKWQFRNLYLERTMRSLPRELTLLRDIGRGPGQVMCFAQNGKSSLYYDVAQVIAYFGGPAAIFHRRDRPEVFGFHNGRVLPSCRPTP